MKNRKFTSLICGSVLSLAGGSLVAQQSATSTDPNSSSSQTSPSSSSSLRSQSTSPSSSALGSSSSLGNNAMDSGNSLRLSQIMNSTVQSQDGKPLGYIRDLTVDPQSGHIELAILALSSAGSALSSSTGGPSPSGLGTTPSSSGLGTTPSSSGLGTTPSSRSTVTGTPSVGSTASSMGKLIPVPWQLFSQSFGGRSTGGTTGSSATGTSISGSSSTLGSPNLVLNIDESKLQSAPSFDASNWNELQGGTLDQRVYSHFGVDRSSATGTSGSSIRGQGTSGSYNPNSPNTDSSSRGTSGSSSSGSPSNPSTSPNK